MGRKSKKILIILFLVGLVRGYSYSGIEIVNVVGEFPSNAYDAIHTSLWNVSDGLDDWDLLIDGVFCKDVSSGGGFAYSEVDNQKCLYDYRPVDSNIPFKIKLFFCGILGDDTENFLWIDYYVTESNETFDDKSIILSSDRFLYGTAIDVRKAIANGCPYGGGWIPLIPAPAGIHSVTFPYGEVILEISTRVLADINADGIVDLKDYAKIAVGFGESGFSLMGDISGLEDVPDGRKDFCDLSAFAKDYLRR